MCIRRFVISKTNQITKKDETQWSTVKRSEMKSIRRKIVGRTKRNKCQLANVSEKNKKNVGFDHDDDNDDYGDDDGKKFDMIEQM